MMLQSRREFLRSAAVASLWAAGGCRALSSGDGLTVGGVRIGVQMWSVDKLWKKDPVTALRRLRALGYEGVQSLGFYTMDWDELERMLDGEGLCVVDMPFRMKMLQEDEGKFVAFCQRFGVGFVYEPFARYSTGWEWRKHAAELAAVRDRLAARGLVVGYHNHQHEIRERHDGKSPYEYLADANLAFELDVGHVKLAGGDPVALLKTLKGRVPTIHAKPGGGNSVGGAGDANDWPAIFRAAAAAGTTWAVVECETRRDTYEDVEATMAFLRQLKV